MDGCIFLLLMINMEKQVAKVLPFTSLPIQQRLGSEELWVRMVLLFFLIVVMAASGSHM